MSYFWVGDKPLDALVLVPTRGGTALDLSKFHGVSMVHVKPSGVTHVRDTATIDDDALEIDFAGESWFDEPGLHQLRCTLEAQDGRQQRMDAIWIVVHEDDGWHSLPSARSDWADAPQKDERLYQLLELAKQQVLAFAPPLDEFQVPPLNYRFAQLQQARNLLNASRVDPSNGSGGDDSFTLTPFPLDWTVKQMLRPKSARPVAL